MRLVTPPVVLVLFGLSACGEASSPHPSEVLEQALASDNPLEFKASTLTLTGASGKVLSVEKKHLGRFERGAALPSFDAEFPLRSQAPASASGPEDRTVLEDPDRMIGWVGFTNIDEGGFDLELYQARSADLVAFGQAAMDAGETRARHGSLPITDVEDPSAPRSWSDGIDTRTRRSNADGYTSNTWPFRTIGRLNLGDGCTGTLIGQRTVLTAAHCVYDRESGTLMGGTFTPRRDSGATQAPHGSADWGANDVTLSYWIPAGYLADPCTGHNCNAWDIALIELSDNLGDTVGGMGYGPIAGADLEDYSNMMRGYPSCNATRTWSPSRPDNSPGIPGIQCTNGALYGDTNFCDVGGYTLETFDCYGDGWHCEIHITCDGSPGMSGAAVYTYDAPWANGNPVVAGVYSHFGCVPGGPSPYKDCTDPTENVITRITPTLGGMIAMFKANNGSW